MVPQGPSLVPEGIYLAGRHDSETSTNHFAFAVQIWTLRSTGTCICRCIWNVSLAPKSLIDIAKERERERERMTER